MLTEDGTMPPEVKLCGTTCLVINGQAIVMAVGKRLGLTTFGKYEDVSTKSVSEMGEAFHMIDISRILSSAVPEQTPHI